MHFHQSFEKDRHYGYRCWLHGKRHILFQFEGWLLNGSLQIGWNADDEDGTISLCLGLFSVYFSSGLWRRPYPKPQREMTLSFHNGALWWRLWTDPHSWSSDTPKWRHGSFNFVDFVLGRSRSEHVLVESRDVLVPMPEKAYPATAKLERWTWRRPRWFAKTINRVTIDIPNGIPVADKGENSWDCGDDATFGLTTGECNSIPAGVGQLVTHMLERRVRYGGWEDWTWKRGGAAA